MLVFFGSWHRGSHKMSPHKHRIDPTAISTKKKKMRKEQVDHQLEFEEDQLLHPVLRNSDVVFPPLQQGSDDLLNLKRKRKGSCPEAVVDYPTEMRKKKGNQHVDGFEDGTCVDDSEVTNLGGKNGADEEVLLMKKKKKKKKKNGHSNLDGTYELETHSIEGHRSSRKNKKKRTKQRADEHVIELDNSRDADFAAEDSVHLESVRSILFGSPSKGGIEEEGILQVDEEVGLVQERRSNPVKKKNKVGKQGILQATEDDFTEGHEIQERAGGMGVVSTPKADHLQIVPCNSEEREVNLETSEKQHSKKSRKVTFSDQNVVWTGKGQKFNGQGAEVNVQEVAQEEDKKDTQYVWGKRFTKEEDDILKCAVLDYIKAHGWDENEGLKMILNSNRYKEARNCWAVIRQCLPHRPKATVRFRAHILLEEGTHLGKWSEEERQGLIRLQEEYGRNWRKISTFLGRGRTNIKEKWRTLKRARPKGRWSQDELQKLSDLVHKCLRLKMQLKISRNENDHRMLRDNINWETIADEIGTHGHGSCCTEWYYTLASSMVVSGEWSDADDRLLLQRLLESGAASEEEVEWGQLLKHRTGQTCMNRWKQMVKHLGENRTRLFSEKIDLLAQRYAPELLQGA